MGNDIFLLNMGVVGASNLRRWGDQLMEGRVPTWVTCGENAVRCGKIGLHMAQGYPRRPEGSTQLRPNALLPFSRMRE